MNFIFFIILGAIILDFLIGSLSAILNIRYLKTDLPEGLEDVYDIEEYRTSQEYTRTQLRFSLVVSFWKIGILLIFWFAGGFNYLDQMVRGIGVSDVWTGVAFMVVLSIINTLSSIPFDLYGIFVIEEKFGFNKTTYSVYILDKIKVTLISAVIGIPMLIGILYFFENTGAMSWLYVWLFVIFVSFSIQVIAPVWIMPIFNKFTPLEAGELRNAIIGYVDKVKFTYSNIYIIDGSRRSAHSNAFFTGFGKTKRIALFDTLMDQLSTDEIVSVIAHEVGHNKKGHILMGMVLSIVHIGIMLFLLSLMLENRSLFDAFFMEEPSIYASIVFFALLFTPVDLVISPILQWISRRNEYQADDWAIATIADGENLVSGLKKLAAKNLANLSPHPMFVMLNYSHPPLLDRIKSMRFQITR
jgi:STE24 endopeptidase